MIIITNTREEMDSVTRAFTVIDALQRRSTLPTLPDTQDTPWVQTAWPHEWYL